jgi:ssDNA-binding Zn-finger/Zn-ribbon topoisomerase 1
MTLRYAATNELREYRCPQCRLFMQRKPTGTEVECPNCHNTIKAHDHGAGDFTFEVWTGEYAVNGDKEWTWVFPGERQKSRVL